MKRVIWMLALLLLLACAPKEDAVFVDPNAKQGGKYGTLYFEADGVRFGVFDAADDVFSALPQNSGTFVGTSCAFADSQDTFYTYDGFQIMTNVYDVERVTAITIADDTVRTPQGVYIGMTVSDAENALGMEAQTGGFLQTEGTCTLSVVVQDGVVTAIQYVPAEGLL